ncbi:hypothetical protein GCM10007389_39950 [Pontibacter akesuensis]|nr:hypothetical protein GCM10007389_39950 [Pontibacter akesuensis]
MFFLSEAREPKVGSKGAAAWASLLRAAAPLPKQHNPTRAPHAWENVLLYTIARRKGCRGMGGCI